MILLFHSSSSSVLFTGADWRGLFLYGDKVINKEKLTLFIDDKNIYHEARRAFFTDTDPHYYGQIKPIELGQLICTRSLPSHMRKLHQVRIYTGAPDATKEPKTYSAHVKQRAIWEKAGAEVISRTLRYPYDWPSSKAEQKGVDVALAVDFVALAIDGEYDVGVIASVDSDLKPALEYVKRKCNDRCHIEVTSWNNPLKRSRLSISGCNIWCHWLEKTDFDSIADLNDYNL